MELADVVIVLGVDPTNEAPMLDFAIRQAMRKAPLDIARKLKIPDWDANAVATALQDARGLLYIVAPWQVKLAEIVADSAVTSPQGVLDFAAGIMAGFEHGACEITNELLNARKPLIVTGVSAGADAIRAAARLANALCERGRDCGLFVTMPEANTMGVGMLGGMSVDQAISRVESGEADTLLVLENDLSRRIGRAQFESLMKRVRSLIVLDCIQTETTRAAGNVIPTASYFESDGTFVNNECRAQRFYAVHAPPNVSRPAWQALQELAEASEWAGYDDVLRELASEKPEFAPALNAAPPADWRSSAERKVARQSHRFSGRTAKDADWTIDEPMPPPDPDTPLAFTMEGDQNPPAGPLVPRFWWPGWNSGNSINKFQIEVGGPLHGGNSGKRLTPVEGHESKAESRGMQQPIGPEAGEFWVIPRPKIFGSEELSRRAQGIQEIIPPTEAQLCTSLMEKLGLSDGQNVEIEVNGASYTLPVRIDDSIADGVVCVPMGYDETRGITAPAVGRLK